ncbi:MAG: Acetyltransferase domain [Devosia sp.]|jgi:GNAT superfamily N-acetyltransferase|nr:Acetyltransferase domain [Devosia sp.]
MALRRALAHYQTFARLHVASAADGPEIDNFLQRAPSERGLDQEWWRRALAGEGCSVLVATECQLVVGIGVIEHASSAPEAELAYLCVLPDARGRGIGQLLLQTLVGRARSEGAAIVRAWGNGEPRLAGALLRCGFTQTGGGAWCFGLWDAHVAQSYGSMAVPDHSPVAPREGAAQSLLLMMAALDKTMLLTHRARQVLRHELGKDQDSTGAAQLALAAARRGYCVWLDRELAESLAGESEAVGSIVGEVEPLSPERILGHLSRGHLCLLHLLVPRLSGPAPTWYIVDGFDGYLFRVHDVTRVDDRQHPLAITACELRAMLRGLSAEDHLIMGRLP